MKKEGNPLNLYLFYFLLIAGLPVAVVCFLQVGTEVSRWWLFASTWLLTAGFFISSGNGKNNDFQILGAILFSCSFILASDVTWNLLFYYEIKTLGYTLGIFRDPVQSFHAPLYGAGNHPAGWYFLYSLVPVLIFIAGCIFIFRKMEKNFSLFLITVQLLLILGFAFTQHNPQLEVFSSHYETFMEALPLYKNLPGLMKDYVDNIGKMGEHNDHYPPGNLLILMAGQKTGFPQLKHVLVILCSLFTCILIRPAALLLGFDKRQQTITQLLYVTAASVLIFSTVDFVPVIMLFFLSATWFFLKCVEHIHWKYILGLGISSFLFLFFSFSACVLGLFLFVFSFLLWKNKILTLKSWAIVFFSVFLFNVLAFYMLQLLSGFNILSCLTRGYHTEFILMKKDEAFNAGRFFLTGWGNALAFFTGADIVIIATALVPGRISQPANLLQKAFSGATLITVIIISFSRLFSLETERAWLFLVPCFTLMAAYKISFYNRGIIAAVVISSLLTACSLEMYLWQAREKGIVSCK